MLGGDIREEEFNINSFTAGGEWGGTPPPPFSLSAFHSFSRKLAERHDLMETKGSDFILEKIKRPLP